MTKVSKEPENSNETDFTERVLLSLIFDVTCLAKNVEQVKVKVYAIAKERGLPTPPDKE